MAGITGIGGSGLDIDNIVKTMVSAEKAPKQNQLTKTESTAVAQLTAVGSLKGAISEFQSALSTLNSPSSFLARSVSVSKSDVLTATASQSAGLGSYQVEVKQLAAGSKVALAAVNATGVFSKGSLNIKVGDTSIPSITIDSTNNTLSGVRDAINAAGKSQGLSATIVSDTQGARLVLSSNQSGDGNDIAVSVANDDGSGSQSLSKLAFTPPAKPTDSSVADPPTPSDPAAARMLTRAQSALMTVDGLQVSSKTNTVSDAIEGVSFTLKTKTDKDSPLTVGVSQDDAGVKGNVKKFVDAYNKLMGVIKTQTAVTSVGESSAPITGALVGDATTRTLTSTIRNELVNMQGTGSIKALADLGITTQKDGTLAIDDTKLSKKVSENFSDVASFFTGDNGLAARMKGKLDVYTQAGGILEQRTSSLSDVRKKVAQQQTALDARMTSLQERLYKQYNAMDSTYSQLSSTASQLASSLAAMPFATKSS
ncbi:flagellar filament capping protein FliD [Pseudomonas sp. JUb52]|uniref:flagellar filament capping protein FliD n=1 Tax=Pseudomonas sp. JUb52 TaxID=2485127 RepID=UPI0010483A6B|nr:flagellar filament capping protein FliD [Pseudomonas sp. JUb52]TCQ94311.1 flagellar hook-associated protein 2 [Pseudomonas sp. JUb52]